MEAKETMKAEFVIFIFFLVCGGVVVLALAIIGISFAIMSLINLKNSKKEGYDKEYITYQEKGCVQRFCYGCCVAADTILTIFEIAATGVGSFIALIPNTPAYLMAIMLITTFISSTFRNALNLKYLRKAYAKAFRILEFAVDEYRISEQTFDDKLKLQEANKQAQAVIENFNE